VIVFPEVDVQRIFSSFAVPPSTTITNGLGPAGYPVPDTTVIVVVELFNAPLSVVAGAFPE
jgi:hypothetical protein